VVPTVGELETIPQRILGMEDSQDIG